MKRTAIVVETKLGIVEYMTMVEALVDGYFDVDGTYQPQIGIANAMRLFYNNCVKQSDLDGDMPHHFSDIMLVEKLAANDDFIRAFNDAISGEHEYILDFANAFSDARDIVETKKSSFTSVIEQLKSMIASIAEVMTPENLAAATQIARDISSGKIDYSKIMAGFAGSPEFKKIIDSKEKDNVVTIKKPTNM